MKYKIINKKKLYLTIFADWILRIIFLPINLSEKDEKITPNQIKSILIIRTAYLGDILMTLPVLKPLKERFTDSKISFLVSTSGNDLLKNNPYVDEIIQYDPFWFYLSKIKKYFIFIKLFRKKSFNLIIEARGDIRDILFLVFPIKAKYKVSYNTGGGGILLTHVVPYDELKHKVEYHLDIVRYLGCNTDNIDWNIYLTDEDQKKVMELLEHKAVKKPFVSIHPGARMNLKRWPKDRFASLCDKIIEQFGFPLVLLGSVEEKKLIEDITLTMQHTPISFAGQINLRELAGVISHSTLLICNDSAPMHIAAAMKIPTIAIFGPSKSKETKPYGNIHRVVEKDFPCRYRCDESFCHNKPFHACMDAVEVKDVLEQIGNLLKVL